MAFVAPMDLLVTYMAFGAFHRVHFIFLLAVLDKGKLLLHPLLVMLVLFLRALVVLSCLGVLVSTDKLAVEQVFLQPAEPYGVRPNQHHACDIVISCRYLGLRTLVTVGRGHIRYQRVQFLQLGINKYLGYAHPTTVRLPYRDVCVKLALLVFFQRTHPMEEGMQFLFCHDNGHRLLEWLFDSNHDLLDQLEQGNAILVCLHLLVSFRSFHLLTHCLQVFLEEDRR